MPTVSIVIVCMNNLQNLYPCLDSIKKNTKVSYKTIVVAYLFSKENLQKLKKDYSWITIIESNETRGFAENNNLALKTISSTYCMVLNDDTYFEQPIIEGLINSLESLNDKKAAIISPVLKFPNGDIQYNGREKRTAIDYILTRFKIEFLFKRQKYSNKEGLYQTYNISGACFIIRTNIFRALGYFDERYFFCPEDIALSTKANEKGFRAYVDTNYSIVHVHQASSNNIMPAILPVTEMGSIIFYGRHSWFIRLLLRTLIFFQASIKFLIILPSKRNEKQQFLQTYRNIMSTIFSKKSTKETFIKLLAGL